MKQMVFINPLTKIRTGSDDVQLIKF